MVTAIREKYGSLSVGAKAAIWYTIANLMQKAINVIVVPIYTRLLSTSEYGTYSVFISWLEIFEIITTFRLFFGAYVAGLVKFEDDRERYTSSLLKLSFAITSCFFALYLIFRNHLNQITEMSTCMTILMFLMMYSTPIIGFWKAWERVDNQYILMVVVTLLVSFLTPFFGVLGLLFTTRKAMPVIISRVSIEMIIAVVLMVLYRKRYTQKADFKYWHYSLGINLPLIPYYLSTVILNHSDRIIIEKLVGYSQAGIYSVAYSAAMVMTLFGTAFNSSIQPWLFKKLKSERYEEVPGVLNASLLIIGAFNVLLIAVAPEVVSILAPADYHEAIWIIPPLSASVFIMAFYQNFVNVEFYFNESKITALASIGSAVLNIVLNYLLIPQYGYLTAGYTTLISYMAFGITHCIFSVFVCKRNNCPFSIFGLKKMLLSAVLFSVVTALMVVVYNSTAIRYLLVFMSILVGFYYRKRIIRFIGGLKVS